MAEYEMQESNLPSEDGKRILFPRMKLWGQKDLKEIAQKVSYATSFTTGDILGLIEALTQEMSYQMGQGYSVKINGLGIFTPTLALREGVERESGEEGGKRRNAASICLNDIHFKADKELVHQTGMKCKLERAHEKFKQSSQMFSPQERLERAKDFMQANGYLTVADYCRLTGLLRSMATRELNHWCEQPDAGIGHRGRGSHKVYILRPNR